MADGYVVDTDALEADGKTFDGWSVRLDATKNALPVSIDALAFSIMPGAQDVYTAFCAAAKRLQTYIDAGSTEFDGFARTLLASAVHYAKAENESSADIARLNAELSAL